MCSPNSTGATVKSPFTATRPTKPPPRASIRRTVVSGPAPPRSTPSRSFPSGRPSTYSPRSAAGRRAAGRCSAGRPSAVRRSAGRPSALWPPLAGRSGGDAEQVDHKDEGGVAGDARGLPGGTVPKGGRDHDLATSAHLHADDGVLEAGDHPAERKAGGTAVGPGRIEHLSRGVQGADVLHVDGVGRRGHSPGADDQV